MKKVESQLKKTEKERDQALEKYEQNEQLWEKKINQKDREAQQLLALVDKIKKTETESIDHVAKFSKRVNALENELDRCEQDKRAIYEKQQIALQQAADSTNESIRLRAENQQLSKQLSKAEHDITTSENGLIDTKSQLKECENKVTMLYQKMTDQNSQHVEKLEKSQLQL